MSPNVLVGNMDLGHLPDLKAGSRHTWARTGRRRATMIVVHVRDEGVVTPDTKPPDCREPPTLVSTAPVRWVFFGVGDLPRRLVNYGPAIRLNPYRYRI